MKRWAAAARGLLPGIFPLLMVGVAMWPSAAAGIRNLADGWLLGPAATAAFIGGQDAPGGGVWAMAGQNRLYGLPELPVTALCLGARLGRLPGQPTVDICWQSLGRGLYREDDYRVHFQVGKMPVLGVALRSVAIHTGGYAGIQTGQDHHWQAAVTIQAGWQGTAGTHVQTQLWLSLAAGGSVASGSGRRPLLRMQGWQGPLALALAVDLTADRVPTVGLEWDLAWGGGGCGLRLDPATGSLGPVLYWRRRLLLVRTSHLVHPQLGVTHRVQLGVGNWGAPRW